MKTVHIVFTVVDGNTYVICHTEEKGFYVKANPSDDEVAKWESKDDADRIAEKNPGYKSKSIEIAK